MNHPYFQGIGFQDAQEKIYIYIYPLIYCHFCHSFFIACEESRDIIKIILLNWILFLEYHLLLMITIEYSIRLRIMEFSAHFIISSLFMLKLLLDISFSFIFFSIISKCFA